MRPDFVFKYGASNLLIKKTFSLGLTKPARALKMTRHLYKDNLS